MEERIVNGIRITEDGEMLDAKTGAPIGDGNLLTGITLDTSNSEVKTIEEMGGTPLTETEEEYKAAMRKIGFPVMKSSWEIIYEHEHPGENAVDVFLERQNPQSFYNEVKRKIDSDKSKYEVKPDTSFVVRFGIMDGKNGKFLPIMANEIDFQPGAEAHWVKFRMWSYDEKVKWRSEFMEFNASKKKSMVNVDKLNERKIRSLLLDWSFGKYGDDMKLLHCNGKLSNDSYSLFLNLYPSIANMIVDLMNSVLDD